MINIGDDQMINISISRVDFDHLCTCAIRYCQGRKSYMPSLVRSIVEQQIDHISDYGLKIMIDDCDYQRKMNLYGDENCDKNGWLAWEKFLLEEQKRRETICGF